MDSQKYQEACNLLDIIQNGGLTRQNLDRLQELLTGSSITLCFPNVTPEWIFRMKLQGDVKLAYQYCNLISNGNRDTDVIEGLRELMGLSHVRPVLPGVNDCWLNSLLVQAYPT